MEARLSEIVKYADTLLDTQNTPDYANALNGLQIDHRGPVRGISAAVDFSTAAINGAVEQGSNLLLVHHGMFWTGLESMQGPSLSRLRLLLEHDIAVYSSHLPLDRHATLGNNVLLAREIGLTPTASFAMHYGIAIGVRGEEDIETSTLIERVQSFSRQNGGDLRTTRIEHGRRTKRWGICSGAGASADILAECLSTGIDTLIVGEGPHWTAVFARENDLTIFYAGHYATETLGVRALAEHLSEKFNVPWNFVSAPTGL